MTLQSVRTPGPRLLGCQSRALEHVASATPDHAVRERALAHLRRWRRGLPDPVLDRPGVLTMNFHPDRPVRGAASVLDSILHDGVLRNRFETLVTNGFTLRSRLDACVAREQALFGGAYSGTVFGVRPKFAAVNLVGNPRGAWPRFGSSHWVLDDTVRSRCSVTIPGSHAGRAWWGTFETLDGLLEELRAEPAGPADGHRYRITDGAVEAQVHGEIRLDRDVVALVLDPSFDGTPVASTAREIADRYDIELRRAPVLHGSPGAWRTHDRRRYAGQRLDSARQRGDLVTAAWIGSDRPAASVPATVVDGVRRYLWNRLLLTQAPASSAGADLTRRPDPRRAPRAAVGAGSR